MQECSSFSLSPIFFFFLPLATLLTPASPSCQIPLHSNNNDNHPHKFITYCEPLIHKGISMKNTKWNKNHPMVLSFRAFKRDFHLLLKVGSPLLAPAATIVTHDLNRTTVFLASKFLQKYVTGYVKGELASHVQGHVSEGRFEGIITLPDEIYYVEKLGNTSPESLIYRQSDINFTALLCGNGTACEPFRLDAKNGPVEEGDAWESPQKENFQPEKSQWESSQPENSGPETFQLENSRPENFQLEKSGRENSWSGSSDGEISQPEFSKRGKSQGEYNARRTVPPLTTRKPPSWFDLWARRKTQSKKMNICTLKLVADYTFYQKAAGENVEMTVHEMVVLITVADNIFRLTDFDRDGRSDGVGFQFQCASRPSISDTLDECFEKTGAANLNKRILRMNIARAKVASVVIWKTKEDVNHRMNLPGISSEDFLAAFALQDSGDVCMAICFVHRIFPGNVLGLAYTASVKHNHAGGICQKRTGRPPRSYNSAVVTVEGSTGRIPRALNGLTLTHELGHSFGSDHDPKTPRCSPPVTKGGPYLMAETIENSNQTNNNKFSPCSVENIAKLMNVKGRCLISEDELSRSTCGNGILEKGEECDCGLPSQCNKLDPCCVPKGGLGGQRECKLIKHAQCSPRNGPCCNQDCIFVEQSEKMVCSSEECTEVSHCSGWSAKCPDAKPRLDGRICNDGEGNCFSGKCIFAVCSRYNFQDCVCQNRKYGCHVCCLVRGQCLPASHLGIKNRKGARYFKPDGEKCNYGHGVCQNGLCEGNVEIQDGRAWNETDFDLEEGGVFGFTLLDVLLASASAIILVIVISLIIYFLTPLRTWLSK